MKIPTTINVKGKPTQVTIDVTRIDSQTWHASVADTQPSPIDLVRQILLRLRRGRSHDTDRPPTHRRTNHHILDTV